MPLTDIFTSRAEAAEIAWTMACRGFSEIADRLLIPDVEALIDVAVKQTCGKVFTNGEWQRLQQERGSIATTNGQAILDAAVIPDSVRPMYRGRVKHSNTTLFPRAFEWLETPDELYYPHKIKKMGFYSLVGGNSSSAVLLLADGAGLPVATGTLTVRACEYYEFDTLPSELNDDFLLELSVMARTKALTFTPGGMNAGRDQAVAT